MLERYNLLFDFKDVAIKSVRKKNREMAQRLRALAASSSRGPEFNSQLTTICNGIDQLPSSGVSEDSYSVLI